MNRDARGRFIARLAPLTPLWHPNPIYAAVVRDQGFDPRADQVDHGIENARKERERG